MSYVNKINDGIGTHLIEPTLYAVAAGTSSTYTAAISNFALLDGTVVHIKFTTTNAANATLNVNSTGAKPIKYLGLALPAGSFVSDRIYSFVCTYVSNEYAWELISDLPRDDRIELVDMMEGT